MRLLLNEPWLLFLTVAILRFASSMAGYGLALATRTHQSDQYSSQNAGRGQPDHTPIQKCHEAMAPL